MVYLFRTVHFGVSALLLASIAFASPLPNPEPSPFHLPGNGEIVHYEPHPKSGISSLVNGHPATHITVGHDHQGNAILAPVVNERQGIGHPRTSAHGMGSLSSSHSVLLDQTVTAHPDDIHQASGGNKGHVISKEHLDRIRGGQALVHAYHTAGAAHHQAYQAHRQAADLHRQLALQHHTAGRHAEGHWENLKSKEHKALAEKHRDQSTIHLTASRYASEANPPELHRVQQSAEHAWHSELAGHQSAYEAKQGLGNSH